MFLTVSFTDLSTGSINTWYWDFGDGYNSSEKNPAHYYANPGVFTVSLVVTGLSGTYTSIKIDYVTVTNFSTIDIAPEPDKKAYLWGSGIVSKKPVGIEIKNVFR
jgi:large repetitive protein